MARAHYDSIDVIRRLCIVIVLKLENAFWSGLGWGPFLVSLLSWLDVASLRILIREISRLRSLESTEPVRHKNQTPLAGQLTIHASDTVCPKRSVLDMCVGTVAMWLAAACREPRIKTFSTASKVNTSNAGVEAAASEKVYKVVVFSRFRLLFTNCSTSRRRKTYGLIQHLKIL